MQVKYEEELKLGLIADNDREFQPRLDYDEVALKLLEDDISRNGQHNPVGVHKKDDYYQVIYGFQRVIAMKRLGREYIRANIYEDATEQELHAQAISNNERHIDLNDLERALYVSRLKAAGVSVDQLCQLFGLNKSVIYNLLSVCSLDQATQDCLRIKRISLNHAVELAREEDISKRLEILTRVLSFSWSVRDLKQYQVRSYSPVGYVGVLGDVELCPGHLRRVCVEKSRTDDEMKRSGFRPGAIEQEVAAHRDQESCEECEYFRGLTEDWFVQCAFDQSKLLAGIRSLVDMCRVNTAVDNDYPILREHRTKSWSRLVKPPSKGVTLIGLQHLKVGLFGYFQDELDAMNEDIAKSNKVLQELQERFEVAEASEDKASALTEFIAIARYAGELQNSWAERTIRAERAAGQILMDMRNQHGQKAYQVLNPIVRIAEEKMWRREDEGEGQQVDDIFSKVIQDFDAILQRLKRQ